VSTSSPIGRAIVALAALCAAGATLVLGAAAQVGSASASASCVAVVVDFRLLGGSVQTGCAQGDPSSGLQALTKAGFGFTPRPRDGLICQINARPACTDTTTTKYWSYWYRAAGSTHWVYATEGPATHNPRPGSTEGWVWQDGGRTPPPATRAETICPQLAATPTPTKPKPTHEPSRTASAPPTAGRTHAPAGTPTAPASTSASRGSAGATASPTSSPRTSSSGASTSTSVAPSTDEPTSGAAADPTDKGGGGALGGAAGVALGSAVVLGIGAATVVRARRGRSA
jgi:hypothetical protein